MIKMNVLVISSYPNHVGFNYCLQETVIQNINKNYHQVKVIDLYQEKFNPVLIFNEENKRRFLAENEETKKYREAIVWAEMIIYIYPIWWSGMPAILKGFIDRVFAKDFAYYYKGIFPIGLLKGKVAWIINTHDSPKLYANFIQKDYGRILNKQILKMCGIKTIRHTSLSYVRGSTQKQRESFIDLVAKISCKI